MDNNKSINKLLRYAAVDIGSNAVRLLLCNVVEEHNIYHFKKSELVRIPLRLGDDVFRTGKILSRKAERFIKTMQAFKLLIDVFDPVAYRACATASMREAYNGEELAKRIRKETGLRIEIISGKQEAELIYANHIEDTLEPHKSYLYIDVGGGSTEITLFDKRKVVCSKSFNIGTLRWLHGKVSREQWEAMKQWIKDNSAGHQPLTAIGSGGNINKIFRLLGRKDKPLTFIQLKSFYEEIKPLSIDDRMEYWGLNPDRADVIVPATKIFLGIMKAVKIENVIVPQFGLADGIVHQLHDTRVQSRVA
jgi:exopolyphosphatase / guanosine-5'-triphosphate,3'-diphosphate pyrophosphatase